MTPAEHHCLVCGTIEWSMVCHMCGAAGWTEKAVLQAIVRRLGGQ